ncbi:MAG: hypothetical protein IPP77_11240 [Bacteroidetes bacterium]|nr:hypothetical protein [Bacteroidota bacterium]
MKLVRGERIPHAMMLAGPEGNGGLALALALSQYIHCENKQEEDSCGNCPSCIKNQKFIHPDLHFTFPVITKKPTERPISSDYISEWRNALTSNPYMNANEWLKQIGAENQQGNITVRECHEIIRRMSLKTYESDYKIQIIWLAEYLRETGNTLLKVIEEPPADTIFILVVENVEMILNTILSRTQIIKVNGIDDASIKNALLQKFEISDEAAQRIARMADGNFNAALSMADGHENANDTSLRKWLGYCYNLKMKPSAANTENLFEFIEEAAKWGRENQKIFIRYALFFLRECLLICVSGHSEKLEGEELKFAKGLSEKLDDEQIQILTQLLNRMYYHVERNANPKILFTSNSFQIASVFKQEVVEID